jgi:hypothetical protein
MDLRFGDNAMDDLPPILPKFFVPRLEDKPQNPIMDTLRLSSENIQSHMPRELAIISTISDPPRPPRRTNNLWLEAMSHNSGIRVHMFIVSNHALFDSMIPRAKHYRGIDSGHPILLFRLQLAFFPNKKVWCLQQLDISALFVMIQNQCSTLCSVHSPLRDPSTAIVYVTQNELLMALKMTILGTSSVFHAWDPSSERFVQAGIEEGKHGLLMVDEKDEVVSQR